LKWDEKAIEEHDQLRGTRMKIDEPNTPYTHYDSGSETDGSASRPKSPITEKHQLQWDHLERKLDSVAAVRDAYPSSPSSHASAGDIHDPEEKKAEMKALEFKDHRKRHYNEMELVRQFRKEHPDQAEPLAANDNEEENNDNDADDEDE
jgi:protein phosphatase inhibitor 2